MSATPSKPSKVALALQNYSIRVPHIPARPKLFNPTRRARELGILDESPEAKAKRQREFDVLTGKPFEEDFLG